MNKHSIRPFAGALAVAALGGCASTSYEGKYEWSEGWRKGQIEQIATGSQLERPEFYMCIREADAQQRGNQRFAVVKYLRMGKANRHAHPLPVGNRLVVGDEVYVNVDSCGGDIVKRQG